MDALYLALYPLSLKDLSIHPSIHVSSLSLSLSPFEVVLVFQTVLRLSPPPPVHICVYLFLFFSLSPLVSDSVFMALCLSGSIFLCLHLHIPACLCRSDSLGPCDSLSLWVCLLAGTCLYMYLCIHMSPSPCVCVSLSVYVYIFHCVSLFWVCLGVCLCLSLSVSLFPVSLTVCLSLFLAVFFLLWYFSEYWCVYLSVYVYTCVSFSLCVPPYVCLCLPLWVQHLPSCVCSSLSVCVSFSEWTALYVSLSHSLYLLSLPLCVYVCFFLSPSLFPASSFKISSSVCLSLCLFGSMGASLCVPPSVCACPPLSTMLDRTNTLHSVRGTSTTPGFGIDTWKVLAVWPVLHWYFCSCLLWQSLWFFLQDLKLK